ncbi:MAG: phosphoenolpyruvate synthase [Gammaproteobacteria bacterium]|nr:MAG: phosphoenolpyruvate synthase [Gammaproteobacteria bacterium]
MNNLVSDLSSLRMDDVAMVGGKNASLGEMISNLSKAGVSVPGGFATTSYAFMSFLKKNGLQDKINKTLDDLDTSDLKALKNTGKKIRQWVRDTSYSAEFIAAVKSSYKNMMKDGEYAVAVRSSATAEDLPDASFAGQQETFLNIKGFENVLSAIKDVFASLYNDRAISYREHQGFAHSEVALSAGIQKMARSDIGASGVMFSMDTESGFSDVVFITAAYGLGETVVQGAVNPDEFYVSKKILSTNKPAIVSKNLGSKKIKMIYTDKLAHDKTIKTVEVDKKLRKKFCLSDEHITKLAQYAMIIEKHYKRPMDIEWALDGEDNKLYILQARPETVQSRTDSAVLERYELQQRSEVIVDGRAIGQKIGQGVAKVIASHHDMDKINKGDVLVTDMTDPDWEPIMKIASAIVTNRGGRTCHAAIIARELGVPAVVGCNNATKIIKNKQEVTVSCAEGDTGEIYDGILKFKKSVDKVDELKSLKSKIMLNVGNPYKAFAFSSVPNEGVGLARLEFVINNMIGIHPRALLEFDQQTDKIKKQINKKISGYKDGVDFYVSKIIEGVATLATAFYGKPVIVRMSDFKSNEYANLLGGKKYEPFEENPMIGFRGTSRYLSDDFAECFELECQAIKYVREEMGLENVEVMIPFVRTTDEAKNVVALLEKYGLKRGENNLRLIMMCEVPSNVIMAKEFLEYFDGFSIGSNDLTQLTLGLDRDSGLIAHLFDERNPAIKKMIEMAITECQKQNKYVGICGQGPSDYPELAEWLYQKGISSISLNPDTVIQTWQQLSKI